jgi:hypothetical protein
VIVTSQHFEAIAHAASRSKNISFTRVGCAHRHFVSAIGRHGMQLANWLVAS